MGLFGFGKKNAAPTRTPQEDYELGEKYYNGDGVPVDEAAAARHHRLAADRGHREAQNRLGFFYEYGIGVTQDGAEAVRWYELAGRQGHADSYLSIGDLYREGRKVPKSKKKAEEYWAMAAELGSEGAQVTLGDLCLARGDTEDAIYWFTQADAQGNLDAAKKLWELNAPSPRQQQQEERVRQRADHSRQVEESCKQDPEAGCQKGAAFLDSEDYEQAELWLYAAAKYGSGEACRLIARMRREGLGVSVDTKLAIGWLEQGAGLGNLGCCEELAWIYALGEPLPYDASQVKRWATKAVELGSLEAKLLLETDRVLDTFSRYHRLELTDQAARWMRYAANLGDPDSQFNLGLSYHKGYGPIQPDEFKCEHWYTLAAQQGYIEAAYNLGMLHMRDENWYPARDAFRIGAERGDDHCMVGLAVALLNEPHGKDNRDEATQWLLRAQELGNETATKFLEQL